MHIIYQRNAIRHCRTVEHIDPPRAHTAGSTAFRTIARSQLSDCRFGFSRHPRPRSRHSGHDHANCHTPGANCSFHQISRTRLSLSSKNVQKSPCTTSRPLATREICQNRIVVCSVFLKRAPPYSSRRRTIPSCVMAAIKRPSAANILPKLSPRPPKDDGDD